MSRRRRRKRLPADRKSLVSAMISIPTVIFFIASVKMSGQGGMISRFMSAMGVIFIIVNIYAFIVGSKEMRNVSKSAWSKWTGFLLPAAALLMWVIVYIIGFIR